LFTPCAQEAILILMTSSVLM